MNEIKHDDDWLYENAPTSVLRTISTDYSDLIGFARKYLEHMTRVRVTADELPEIHSLVVVINDLEVEFGIACVTRKRSGKKCWLINECYLPFENFPKWQPILRSGGGV